MEDMRTILNTLRKDGGKWFVTLEGTSYVILPFSEYERMTRQPKNQDISLTDDRSFPIVDSIGGESALDEDETPPPISALYESDTMTEKQSEDQFYLEPIE